ncbi:hypothetical protein SDC9_131687 [bioreactor metagenome]|uniref:Uncharacterized protein n=1 Tax=bioreactor metagenome TaxID=1076179 RepID=A0A645D5M1_9ZZZZ
MLHLQCLADLDVACFLLVGGGGDERLNVPDVFPVDVAQRAVLGHHALRCITRLRAQAGHHAVRRCVDKGGEDIKGQAARLCPVARLPGEVADLPAHRGKYADGNRGRDDALGGKIASLPGCALRLRGQGKEAQGQKRCQAKREYLVWNAHMLNSFYSTLFSASTMLTDLNFAPRMLLTRKAKTIVMPRVYSQLAGPI